MKKIKILFMMFVISSMVFGFTSCKERYSVGERIGTVTKFSRAGVIWQSWDGHLNITQTGMNSAGEPFAFSVDNDHEDPKIVSLLSKASTDGWKVKICYHQVWGLKNVFHNRGESDYFVDSVKVLDKDFTKKLEFNSGASNKSKRDTTFVWILNK